MKMVRYGNIGNRNSHTLTYLNFNFSHDFILIVISKASFRLLSQLLLLTICQFHLIIMNCQFRL